MTTRLRFIGSVLVATCFAFGAFPVLAAAASCETTTVATEGLPPDPPEGYMFIGLFEDENGALWWRYENEVGRVYLVPYDPM